MPSKRYLQWVICAVACITSVLGHAQDPNKKRVQKTNWQSLYQPAQFDQMPLRVMPPIQIESGKKYPLILSLHGAGGTGTDNNKQLRDWNKQLALPQRRKAFPCYVIAPQAQGLWNNVHLNKIQSYIKTLPSVDMNRVYIMGHSMGGHGTYIFIQLAPDYFAAAAPSAGSGLRRTEDFISASKIKDIPIWAFHGDKDKVCPIEKDRDVFKEVKKLGGVMKLTTWANDTHAVSGKMIPGDKNGTTESSSERCNDEPDFMTWLFSNTK